MKIIKRSWQLTEPDEIVADDSDYIIIQLHDGSEFKIGQPQDDTLEIVSYGHGTLKILPRVSNVIWMQNDPK